MVAIIPNEIRNRRFRRNRAAANSLRVQTDGRDPVSRLNKSHLIGSGTPDFLNPFITVLGLPDGHFAHPVPGQWRGLVKTLPSLKDALSCGKKKRLKGSKFQRKRLRNHLPGKTFALSCARTDYASANCVRVFRVRRRISR